MSHVRIHESGSPSMVVPIKSMRYGSAFQRMLQVAPITAFVWAHADRSAHHTVSWCSTASLDDSMLLLGTPTCTMPCTCRLSLIDHWCMVHGSNSPQGTSKRRSGFTPSNKAQQIISYDVLNCLHATSGFYVGLRSTGGDRSNGDAYRRVFL